MDVGGRRYSSPSVSKGEDDHTVTPLMSEDRHAPPKQTTSFPRAMFLLMNAILGSTCSCASAGCVVAHVWLCPVHSLKHGVQVVSLDRATQQASLVRGVDKRCSRVAV